MLLWIIRQLCQLVFQISASFALYKIGKIRNILDRSTAKKLIHTFLTSHLYYCNSLMFGLPAYEIRKVRLIQNSTAPL